MRAAPWRGYMTLIAGIANLWKLSTEGITWETAEQGDDSKYSYCEGKKNTYSH